MSPDTRPQQELKQILAAGQAAGSMATGIARNRAAEARAYKLEEHSAKADARQMAMGDREEWKAAFANDDWANTVDENGFTDGDRFRSIIDQHGVGKGGMMIIQTRAQQLIPRQIDDPNSDDPDALIDNPHWDAQVATVIETISPAMMSAMGSWHQENWDARQAVYVDQATAELAVGPVLGFDEWQDLIGDDEYLGALNPRERVDIWTAGIENRVAGGDLHAAFAMLEDAPILPVQAEELAGKIQEKAAVNVPIYVGRDLKAGNITNQTLEYMHFAGNNKKTADAVGSQLANWSVAGLIDERTFNRVKRQLISGRVMTPQSRSNVQLHIDADAVGIRAGLKPGERNLLDYHRQNLMGDGHTMNEDGSMSTVLLSNVKSPDGKWYLVPGMDQNGNKYEDDDKAFAAAEAAGLSSYPSSDKKRDMDRATTRIKAAIADDMNVYQSSGGHQSVAAEGPIFEAIIGVEPPDDELTLAEEDKHQKAVVEALTARAANLAYGGKAYMVTPAGEVEVVENEQDLVNFIGTHYQAHTGAFMDKWQESSEKRQSRHGRQASDIRSARIQADRELLVRRVQQTTNHVEMGRLLPELIFIRDANVWGDNGSASGRQVEIIEDRLQGPRFGDTTGHHPDLAKEALEINRQMRSLVSDTAGFAVAEGGEINYMALVGMGVGGRAAVRLQKGWSNELLQQLNDNRLFTSHASSNRMTVFKFVEIYDTPMPTVLEAQLSLPGGGIGEFAKAGDMTMRDLYQSQHPAHQQLYETIVGAQLADRRRAMLREGVREPLRALKDGEQLASGTQGGILRADGTLELPPWKIEPGWIYEFLEKYKP